MKKIIGFTAFFFSASLISLPAQDFAGVKILNGAGIYCRVIGRGEPLVVVHGGPGLAHDYLFKPFSRLAGDYRLIFHDQRGCGLSDEFRAGEKVSVDDLVDDLEALRNEFGLQRFNLAGQSWGAIIAVLYAVRRPGQVKTLMLLEPAPGSSDALPEFQKKIMARRSQEEKDEYASLSRNPALASDPGLYKTWMNLGFKPYYFDPKKQDPDKLGYMDAARVRKHFASAAMFGPYLGNFSLFEAMKSIVCPVLIIHGADEVVPTSSIEKMKVSMPQAELHIIKECGHFVHVEKPDEYFGLIRSFLKAGAKRP